MKSTLQVIFTFVSHDKEFLWGKRGFKNQWEMNDTIIKNWNEIIQPEDDVYVLGDLVLSDTDGGIAALKQLKGKIHIIRGNHDSDVRIALYKECYNIVEICDAKWLKIGKQSFFLSHYPCLTSNHDEEKPLNKRIISLCGHTHCKDKFLDWDKGLIYHVELDAHDCKPVSIEYIIEDITNKLKENK